MALESGTLATVAPKPLTAGMSAPGSEAQATGGTEPPKANDIPALANLPSMDFLLKKEGYFLLAQFWQQVSKELN